MKKASMEPSELARILDACLDAQLSRSRAAHSRGVAALAADLCIRHGIDPLRGRIAGLAHDLCKELPVARQAELARISGYSLSSAFLHDKILHGPAAAALLRDEYNVDDEEILAAVAWHTVGKPGMGLLETLVYCADKIEPGRRSVDPVFRERCLGLPPGEMLVAIIEDTMSYHESIGKPVAPETYLLYNALRQSVQLK